MTPRIRSIATHMLVAAAACAASPCAVSGAGGGDDDAVFRVEPAEGAEIEGRLRQITPVELSIDVAGTVRTLSVDSVRRVERLRSGTAAGAPRRAAAVRLTCTDGSRLDGEDFSWEGGQASLVRREGRIELPIGMVRSVAWSSAEGDAARDGGVPGDGNDAGWLGSVPETLESDLVVVAKGEGFEFVECAITAVSADAVNVVLDEEKIPVRRSKVIGLHWLRDDPAAVGPGSGAARMAYAVDVADGSLRAGTIEWSPDGLVLDGPTPGRAVRMPASLLERIDFAAGRTTFLATLTAEKTEVEPFFGALGRIDGLAGFFAPRAVPADRDFPRPGLVMRPKTVAVWRIPAGSRRFRTSVSPATAQPPSAVSIVAVAVDDREVFRRPVDAASGLPIDVDCSGGRRLTLTVDFGTAGAAGGAVRFAEPAIEK